LVYEILDSLEWQRASRQIEVRSGHDGTKNEEAEEDMERFSFDTELPRLRLLLFFALF
jgi:hypothetical protein